jgi:acetate kinase
MGVEFDKKINEGVRGKEIIISKQESPVTVMIVPTDEEFVIASDTRRIVEERKELN